MSIEHSSVSSSRDANHLFPVFLKLEQLSVLIIGGGNIAHEKLQALLTNSPQTNIRLVAIAISEAICELAEKHPGLRIQEKAYDVSDLAEADLLIVAVNDIPLCEKIKQDANKKGILVNVADTPLLCDFYLGSIVSKGHLKIAISTNGKSPTIAKRLKQVISEMIPDEMDTVLNDIHQIRERISGDFSDKVKQLNNLTQILVDKPSLPKARQQKGRRILQWCLFALLFIIVGYLLHALQRGW